MGIERIAPNPKPKKRGGARPGAGRKPVVGGRSALRSAANDPARYAAFLRAVDAELAAGKPDSYLRLFEHAYGRPGQALDVRTSTVEPNERGEVVYVCQFDDGTEAVPAYPDPKVTA